MIENIARKHEKIVYRILEMIPGLCTWVFIFSPIWLSLLYPPAIVYLLTFLSVYWAYLAIKNTIGGIIGYRKFRKEMAVNWFEECEKLDFSKLPDSATLIPSLKDVKHLVLVPMVNEPYEVLKHMFDGLVNQTFFVNQITVVITIEEKYAEKTKACVNQIIDEIDDRNKFDEILIYVHPAGIEGEAIGAGAANRTWGAKHAVEHLKQSGKNLRYYILSTIDSDHVLDRQYIARLTHLYLASDKRDNRYYSSAVYLFNNNNWRVPAVMRIEANFVTLGTLSDWSLTKHPTTKDNFAAYSTSLQTLIDADYWDVSKGIDDTIYYWRAFFVRNGDYVGTPHYIPFSADAVEGSTYFGSYKSLYKQLLRWGYGVIDFPMSIYGFLTNNKIPLGKKVAWTLKHLHKRVILINMVFLITFGFTIATFVNPHIKQTVYAYSLPNIMSVILTFSMIFIIPSTIIRTKIANPMPKNWPFWKKLMVLMEGPLVIINLLTYSFVPYVDAQTRMLFGKKMKDLYHTQKVR